MGYGRVDSALGQNVAGFDKMILQLCVNNGNRSDYTAIENPKEQSIYRLLFRILFYIFTAEFRVKIYCFGFCTFSEILRCWL